MRFLDNKRLLLILFLLIIAAGLRLWGLGSPSECVGEDVWQIPAAQNFVANGHAGYTGWHHPPAGLILLDLNVRIFGDNPYGRKLRNFLLGSLSVALLFSLCLEFFPNERIAFMGALLLALDPLHIAESRSTYDEIPAGFFFLLALCIILRYLKGHRDLLIIAGLAVGFSIASKSYYALGIAVLLVFILASGAGNRRNAFNKATYAVLVLLVLPLTVYALSYLPLFARGYDLREFMRFQIDGYQDLKTMTHKWFAMDFFLSKGGSPAGWFVVPKMFGMQIAQSGEWGTFNISTNNPPIWLMAWPSFIFLGYAWFKGRDRFQALLILLFLSTYIPLVIVNRPIFLYSATAVLPFVFMAIAYSVNSLLTLIKGKKWFYPALLSLLIMWDLYLYPLVTYKEVPVSLYEPLLSLAKIYHRF